MNVKDYLKQVAYLKFVPLEGCDDKDVPKSWLSKFDNSYLTFEGLESDLEFLADREITKELTHGVGLSPKNNKWYGWSHRAICGFGIGSTCKKGDCHYKGSSIDEEIEHAKDFWIDENRQFASHSILDNGNIFIEWKYPNTTPNHSLRQRTSGAEWDVNLGRGEWTAKTMKEAKEMAIDFNAGVS